MFTLLFSLLLILCSIQIHGQTIINSNFNSTCGFSCAMNAANINITQSGSAGNSAVTFSYSTMNITMFSGSSANPIITCGSSVTLVGTPQIQLIISGISFSNCRVIISGFGTVIINSSSFVDYTQVPSSSCGGGLLISGVSRVQVLGSSFLRNNPARQGSVSLTGGGLCAQSFLEFFAINSLFYNNSIAPNGVNTFSGGGLYLSGTNSSYGSVNITNCTFIGNTVIGNPDKSGAIVTGGAAQITQVANITILLSNFVENYANIVEQKSCATPITAYGGALYLSKFSSGNILSSYFSKNFAKSSRCATGGGAIYVSGNKTPLAVRNSLFSGNYGNSGDPMEIQLDSTYTTVTDTEFVSRITNTGTYVVSCANGATLSVSSGTVICKKSSVPFTNCAGYTPNDVCSNTCNTFPTLACCYNNCSTVLNPMALAAFSSESCICPPVVVTPTPTQTPTPSNTSEPEPAPEPQPEPEPEPVIPIFISGQFPTLSLPNAILVVVDKTEFTGDLSLSGLLILQNGTLTTIDGNFDSDGLELILGYNSSIKFATCVGLDNVSLTVNITDAEAGSQYALLESSDPACVSHFSNVSVIGDNNCTNLQTKYDNGKLFAIFVSSPDATGCGNSITSGFPLWAIISISVVGFLVIIIIPLVAVPTIRNKVFPYKDMNDFQISNKPREKTTTASTNSNSVSTSQP